MKKLYNLKPGDKFTWNNIRYIVHEQDHNMTEVFAHGRMWAWPSYCSVKLIN